MQNYYTSQVHEVFDRLGIKLHLSRKKFMVSFILAMIQARDVLFKEIAVYLNDDAKVASNEVRIQNFFRDHTLNYEQIALLLSLFLPPKGKVTLSIDRTEWDFG
ncbi:MAG: transposase, partial [Bacteroidota bacterium]